MIIQNKYNHSVSVELFPTLAYLSTAYLASLLFTSHERMKRMMMDTAPNEIWIMNSLLSPLGSCFTSRITPITISTNPTITLPQNMENVDIKLTSPFLPPVIDTTSFPASILKHPPRKAPLTPLRIKYAIISGSMMQKTTKIRVTPMHEQNNEYPFRCCLILNPRLSASLLVGLLQKQPSRDEPMRVPTLKTMGTEAEYALKPLWVRQVGIQSRNPYRIDLSRPKAKRQSLFSRGPIVCFAKAKNFFHLQFLSFGLMCLQIGFQSFIQSSSKLSPKSDSVSGFASFKNRKTQIPVIIFKATATIIAISHLQFNPLTMNPAKAKPIMLPKSPFADHVPIAVPSFYRLKCSLVRVRRVGQAGNWQKPKTSKPAPGTISLRKQLSWTCSLASRERRGMTRQAAHATVMKMMQDFNRFFLPSSRKRKKKPIPRERQTRASNRPIQRLL